MTWCLSCNIPYPCYINPEETTVTVMKLVPYACCHHVSDHKIKPQKEHSLYIDALHSAASVARGQESQLRFR